MVHALLALMVPPNLPSAGVLVGDAGGAWGVGVGELRAVLSSQGQAQSADQALA